METKQKLKGAKSWKYEKTDSSLYFILEDTSTHSWPCSTNGLFNDEDELKIAKLIAAAPELLEALIQISESYKYCVKNAENSDYYINAINAINKATK